MNAGHARDEAAVGSLPLPLGHPIHGPDTAMGDLARGSVPACEDFCRSRLRARQPMHGYQLLNPPGLSCRSRSPGTPTRPAGTQSPHTMWVRHANTRRRGTAKPPPRSTSSRQSCGGGAGGGGFVEEGKEGSGGRSGSTRRAEGARGREGSGTPPKSA